MNTILFANFISILSVPYKKDITLAYFYKLSLVAIHSNFQKYTSKASFALLMLSK